VSSGASFTNGAVIITNPGTTTQQQYKVTARGGTTTLTVTPAVTTLATGSAVTPLWTNASHLTAEGYSAFSRWNQCDLLIRLQLRKL
jgi:hypothetical protein